MLKNIHKLLIAEIMLHTAEGRQAHQLPLLCSLPGRTTEWCLQFYLGWKILLLSDPGA